MTLVVTDIKPRVSIAIDPKTKNISVSQETKIYTVAGTLLAGMPIGPGLWMNYTYPTIIPITIVRP